MARALEAALSRQRFITAAALVALTVLAWCWLLTGAGLGMDPLVSLAPLPVGQGSMATMTMGVGGWPGTRIVMTLAMWWVMMVAMMLPSAAPMILLYARAGSRSGALARYASESFLGGYLVAWGGFSVLATAIQLLLESAALLDTMLMATASSWLSALLLLVTGVYQVSPFKDSCLRQCRSPAQFLSRHFRPGSAGAFRMGLIHGAYCVGCCWPLMMLLFVGGVMNLAWIALLAVAVAAEKLLPFGQVVRIVTGLALVSWGLAILLRLAPPG